MQKASNLCDIHKDIHTLLGPREAMLHNVGKTPQPFHDQKDKFLDALASLAPTPMKEAWWGCNCFIARGYPHKKHI